MLMRESTAESYRERVLRAQVYLQSRLDEPVDLDEVASVACFSPYHFHRIFRGITGEPLMEHMRRLRLERAAQRLKSTERSVIDIALEAGYETHEAFTRAFRAMFGDSPTGFRENRPVARGEVAVKSRSDRGDFAVKIERFPATKVAFVRHIGSFEDVGPAWSTLMTWAGMRGMFGLHTRAIGIIHDDPDITDPERLRYDAAVTILQDVAAEGSVGVQEIPACEYAIARHRGPYNQISETYARICGEWLASSNRELASSPALEFYLNTPQTTKPEDLLTDACLPLSPR
jgi:AraC family transcriptional regulator